MTTRETVVAFADQLRQYAEHFEQRDWNYTRNHDIRAIYYISAWARLKDALGYTWRGLFKRDSLSKSLGLKVSRWRMFRAHLRYHNHLPDGVLDGGAIITHWEETGEYLQYVQPSVGSLLADWMEAEPESLHALRIAAEMKRINDAYGERIQRESA